jgi:hypothetical protein
MRFLCSTVGHDTIVSVIEQEAVRILLRTRPKIRQGQDETVVGEKAERDRTECGECPMGKGEETEEGEAPDWEEA